VIDGRSNGYGRVIDQRERRMGRGVSELREDGQVDRVWPHESLDFLSTSIVEVLEDSSGTHYCPPTEIAEVIPRHLPLAIEDVVETSDIRIWRISPSVPLWDAGGTPYALSLAWRSLSIVSSNSRYVGLAILKLIKFRP
jgi:hypothetical protein